MIDQIKLFFEQHLALAAPNQLPETKLQLAAAVLFLEMMAMDDNIAISEQDKIRSILQTHFKLSVEQADKLTELAEQERKQATDYFQFTSLVNKAYSQEQKTQLIKLLWQIAFADGHLDLNEEYFVRKIADLLYVPHIDFIMTKNQVEEASAPS